MHPVLVLGSELTHHSLWYPTILGVLVVVAAVTLFCGSVYLLLATNLGARLGFLVAIGALSGFMVILSGLWMTTSSPLNTLKGQIPAWRVVEVVNKPVQSKVSKVRDITKQGTKVDPTEAANVKAVVDEALITKEALPTAPLAPDANKWAKYDFADVTKYLVPQTYEIGGRAKSSLKDRLFHPPLYAVVEFCPATSPTPPVFGLPPLKQRCVDVQQLPAGDALRQSFPSGSKFMILERDLGSLRVPPIVAFLAAVIVFVLSLLGLHWRERDEQERAAAAAAGPTPAPARAEEETR